MVVEQQSSLLSGHYSDAMRCDSLYKYQYSFSYLGRIGRKGKAAFVTENEKENPSSTAVQVPVAYGVVGKPCTGATVVGIVDQIQKLSSHPLYFTLFTS